MSILGKHKLLDEVSKVSEIRNRPRNPAPEIAVLSALTLTLTGLLFYLGV